MAQVDVYLLMFLTIFVGHVKSSFCDDDGYAKTFYCSYDCCGSNGYQYCCNSYSSSTSPRTISYSRNIIYPRHDVGIIVGLVVGSLAGFGILICIICCCCRQCKGGTSGQVLQPHTNPAFSVTTAATTNGTQLPMTHQFPGMYAPSYPTFPQMAGGYSPQMAGGYSPGNAAMNYPYVAPPPMNNPYGAPAPSCDNVVSQ